MNSRYVLSLLRGGSVLPCLLALGAGLASAFPARGEEVLTSPGGALTLRFALAEGGVPTYALELGGRAVLQPSRLGLELRDQPGFTAGFVVEDVARQATDETWETVWGESRYVRNNYRELAVTLRQAEPVERRLIVRFRLFDDGLGFRYEFPAQPSLTYFVVANERTEFNLSGDHRAFWIPADFDNNEYHYSTTRLSEVEARRVQASVDKRVFTQIPVAPGAIATPLMMKTDEGLYLCLHEAALVDYPAMHLSLDRSSFSLRALLVPDALGNKAYLQAPTQTPWRTLLVSERATDILASKLILNLNEPSTVADTGWIRPMKFVGIWWVMHTGTATWNYADSVTTRLGETDWAALTPNGRHGATTERTKRYIDFAAAHGIDGVLVEGWNVGWEDWLHPEKEEVFDFVTPYPDFNVIEVRNYAAAKGVKMIMHHETAASATNYERRIDEAFRFMKQHGYDAVKTGYVGRIIPRGELHDGQWMVNHYERVVRKAADHRIMVDAHEPVRPTGLHRTYPNWMANEAACGGEYANSGPAGNPPEHETILPFTRLIGGPMDYTPGIFQTRLNHWVAGKQERVHSTLVKQLALYVTIHSPLQMAADYPEVYERHLDAFQFIKDVAVDWDDTWVLAAEPGDYVTIARKARGRDEWFVGAITDEQPRPAGVPLAFLPAGRSFVATLYTDAPDAHWDTNPMAYRIERVIVTREDTLRLRLAAGGGAAVSLRTASEAEAQSLPALP